MAKNEQKRIDLLKKIRADKNTITVSEVEECFSGTISMLDKHTKTFARVKEKLGEAEYSCMLHSLINSFLTSLYCTAAKDEEEMEKRLAEANDTNSDLTVGVAIAVKKG